jgi:hypothetical protein
MAAEKLLANIGASIVSTPHEIDAGCGFAVRLPFCLTEDADQDVLPLITGKYRVIGRGRDRILERLL